MRDKQSYYKTNVCLYKINSKYILLRISSKYIDINIYINLIIDENNQKYFIEWKIFLKLKSLTKNSYNIQDKIINCIKKLLYDEIQRLMEFTSTPLFNF